VALSKDKVQISSMFDDISPKYDFLNHFLSLGFDKLWRRKAIKILKLYKPLNILDIATGTGDFAIEALRLNPGKITGIDISPKMIELAKIKVIKCRAENIINFNLGDSENIPEPGNYFDAITVGFGVRNFENLTKGLSEMYRVIKPGGIVLVLEFSVPETIIVRQLYYFYFNFIIPKIGKLFSKHNYAYSYLPDSVYSFPSGREFNKLLEEAGFTSTKQLKLTFGVASIYTGIKK
jgi:demethylmenaquinone methyltransferase / 2-methoxy-6-polyprenyl-1,4-benzoquinol methylase